MRKRTAYGPGWDVGALLSRSGAPAERRKISATEEVLIYRGKKTLYKGTREKNSSAGFEWREIRVRDGQLVEESEALQIIEYLGRKSGDLACEQYGSKNTLSCFGNEIEPIGALPAMSAEAALPFDFGCPKDVAEPRLGRRRTRDVEENAFQDLVIAELHAALEHNDDLQVYGGTPPRKPRFTMGMNVSPAETRGDDPYTTRRCGMGAELTLFAQGNEVGRLSVGVCDRHRELTFADVCAAKASLTRTVYELDLDPAKETLQRLGIPPQKKTLESGDTLEYFSAIMVGHGIGFMRTSVLTPRASQQNVIAQANLDNACDRLPDLRLCTHTQEVLEQIERTIVTRFFEN